MQKKNSRNRKLGEISLQILKAIGDGAVDFIDVMTTLPPGHYQSGAYRVRYRQAYQRTHGLRQRGYVKIQKKSGKNQSFFSLTPKGRLELLRYLHLEKIWKQKWDGRWRVIIFDIPEKDKKRRDSLRAELKYLGFRELQRSVYIAPHPVSKELDHLLKQKNLRHCFRYLTVTEIDGEEGLKKAFKIKK